MFVRYNANPEQKIVGDCVVRAISRATGANWDFIYDELCNQGKRLADMPSSNVVWGTYLKDHGFQRINIPNTCPMCYTVRDFANDNQRGVFVLGTGSHAVAVIDGVYYDTWDSGDEVPMYVFRREF